MNETVGTAHQAFDWVIVAYFFLGGLAAGAFCVSVACNYWKRDLKPLAKSGALIALVALSMGMALLLLDLGKPFRFWRILVHFNPGSALSWGVWFLNIFFALGALYAFFLYTGKDKPAKACAYAGLPFALLVAGYTGVLLNQAPTSYLWGSALLAPLFAIGGILSGMAAVMLAGALLGHQEETAKLGRIAAVVLVVEVLLVGVEIVSLLNGSPEAVATAKGLLGGQYGFLFWGVEIFLGAAIPVFLLTRKRLRAPGLALASVLVLAGVFAMRYIVVIGGQALG